MLLTESAGNVTNDKEISNDTLSGNKVTGTGISIEANDWHSLKASICWLQSSSAWKDSMRR